MRDAIDDHELLNPDPPERFYGGERTYPSRRRFSPERVKQSAPVRADHLGVRLSVFRFLRESHVIYSFPITINPLSWNIGAHPFRRGHSQDIERRMQCLSDTF